MTEYAAALAIRIKDVDTGELVARTLPVKFNSRLSIDCPALVVEVLEKAAPLLMERSRDTTSHVTLAETMMNREEFHAKLREKFPAEEGGDDVTP